jgi:hypothetical protein
VKLAAHLHLDRADETVDVVAGARPIRANYVTAGNVAVPRDVVTLMAFSMYAHLERAALHFEALGAGFDTPAPVYYEPIVAGGALSGVAYFAGADFFAVDPGAADELPVAANPGVLAHESSHRVWHNLVWQRRLLTRLPAIAADAEQLAAFHLLRAADEGIADYFAAVVTGNPAYHGDSFYHLEVRSLDRFSAVEVEWVDGTAPTVAGQYNPYALGTVLASTLWRARAAFGTDLDSAVVASLRAVGDRLSSPLQYDLGDLELEILRRVDACTEFEEAYAVIWARFASVCR